MKKIMLVLPDCSLKGGAEQYMNMLATCLLEKNHVVHVFFTSNGRKNEWRTDIPDLHLHFNKFRNGRYGMPFLTFGLLFRRKMFFDCIFTSHVHCTFFAGMLRQFRVLRTKYFVARESTSIFKRFTGRKLSRLKIFYRLGYPAVDLLVCQTGYMKKQLLENLPWMEKKVNVQVIPNPVDVNNMLEKAGEELEMPVEGPFIVSAGRFIPEKGFDILIRVFHELKREYRELKLVILGDGRLRGEIEALVKELELEDEVILRGFVDNVYPFFKHARMCVVSSRIEGFPNVLLQEMSQNEKVVSTLCAGDIDKIEGLFTCRPNDERDLLRAMRQCLEAGTTRNREIFDMELENRSIDKFIERITSHEKEHARLNEKG